MEKSEENQIRIQTCQKCYEHQNYDYHSEQQYRSAFQAISHFAQQINIRILRNVPPKYLHKIPDTKSSSKRYMDTNTGKITQFPTRGSFEVYYKNILIYSKLLVGAFPDLEYLNLIIKQIHGLYQKNASILASLQKFRDIEYEWKKNSLLTQSLYTFIKLNTCGNNSAQFLTNILTTYLQNYNKIQKKGKYYSISQKNKIVHPYLLYDEREKMSKMETIYCPKNSSMDHLALTKRLNFSNNQQTKPHITKRRPQTGAGSYPCDLNVNRNNLVKGPGSITKNILRADNSALSYRRANQTYRQAGYITKNHGGNNLFQLVLKQQNKALDQQKLKKWRKQSNLCLEEELSSIKNSKKSHWKSFSQQNMKKVKNMGINFERVKQGGLKDEKKVKFTHNSKRRQDIKIDRTKKVYLAHLDRIKSRMEQKQKFKLNLQNKNSHNLKQNTKRSSNSNNRKKDSNNQKDKISMSSSRFGSIKKNYADLEQSLKLQHDEIRSIKSQKNQSSCKKVNQRSGSSTSRNQNRNSRCLKQSKYSKVKKSIQYKNKFVGGQLSDRPKLTEKSNNNSTIKEPESSRNSVRRPNIEQITVQKRISQRKRSSNHERYPGKNLCLSRYNTLQRQIEQKNSAALQKDSINSNSGESNDDTQTSNLQWQQLKQNNAYSREPAMIVKKFSQQNNFIRQNSYRNRFQQIMEDPHCKQTHFQIKGQELLHKFILKSIRQIYKPAQIRLFPQLFKQIQHHNPNQQTPQTQQTSAQDLTKEHLVPIPSRFYQTKLMHLVNLMLRSNPMMISRIFQDKKSINPHGVYCVWLRNTQGKIQPIFINDQFAVEVVDNKAQGKKKSYKPVYSWLANQNSIWYMLLEKAVAKVLGGYHVISEVNLAQLMSIIMSSPTVDIGYINPQKALKVFDEKIFFNKMASLYTLRQAISDEKTFKQMKQGKRIDRIVGFSTNKRDNKQSAISIKIQQSTLTFSLREFLQNYGEVAILFFNNNYFLNQTDLILNSNEPAVLSCKIQSKNCKNNCYLMFSGFPQKFNTKVTLFRLLSDLQANIKDGMNPLSEENKRYEYVGQISKTGNFFFEVLLNGGDYICLMENKYQVAPSISLFSEYPVYFGEISCNLTKDEQKQKQKKRLKNENKSKINSRIIQQQQSNPTPKILIQHKIPINEFRDEKIRQIKKINKSIMNQTDASVIKINKKYVYELDNIQSDKQNKSKKEKDRKDYTGHSNNQSMQSNRLDLYSENHSKFLEQPEQKHKSIGSVIKQNSTHLNLNNSGLNMDMDKKKNRNINKIIDHYD